VDEPIWLTRLIVDAMHYDQLEKHGGLAGIKDENALEAALARPQNKWAYEPDSDLCDLAAGYGYGLATNHGYSDGNKRIAFVAMSIFLGLNDWEIVASETEVVHLMVDVASKARDEVELASWLRDHIMPAAD